MAAGSDLIITLVTHRDIELISILVECLQEAYGGEYEEAPDNESLASMFTIIWSHPLRGDPSKRLHRVKFIPAESDEAPTSSLLATDLCDNLRRVVEDNEVAIDHVVWFQHPDQILDHGRLQTELYDIEMCLREVLTYIFLDIAPDRCYCFLDGNTVVPQNNDKLTDEYLSIHGENKLFHVLFADYPKINDSSVSKPTELIRLIADEDSYEDLRSRNTDLPVKQSRHAGFLANLKSLIHPIEEVRNSVAHHRGIANRAKENYPNAKDKLLQAIEAFWDDEHQDREEEEEKEELRHRSVVPELVDTTIDSSTAPETSDCDSKVQNVDPIIATALRATLEDEQQRTAPPEGDTRY